MNTAKRLILPLFLLICLVVATALWSPDDYGIEVPALVSQVQPGADGAAPVDGSERSGDWVRVSDGVVLDKEGFDARFVGNGLELEPEQGPEWRWMLTHVETSAGDGLAVELRGGAFEQTDGAARMDRGAIVEIYRDRGESIEQQFLIPERLNTGGNDLVIRGEVDCDGHFAEGPDGWTWTDHDGVVTLGRVTVFDALGRELPARMEATPWNTEIIVDGEALAAASYPVLVDPEIGTDDLQISTTETVANINVDAQDTHVAYNATDRLYLVVWDADSDAGGMVDNEFEIFGQLVDADGNEVGGDFRISNQGGGVGDATFDAQDPHASWNSVNNTFLVVWSGDFAPGQDEINGAILNGSDGTILQPDFRLSDMGPDGDGGFDAVAAKAAYNATDNEWLVVWQGDDSTNGEDEIWGQRISGTGSEIGANDMQLTRIGTDGLSSFDAVDPDVVWNATDNEYLVVFRADAGGVDGDDEIHGQRVSNSGTEIGTDDFPISNLGNGSSAMDANEAEVAWSATDNRYAVVWRGDDDRAPGVDNEFEIFGQALDNLGNEVGPDDLRISNTGTDGLTTVGAFSPDIAWDSVDNEWIVVWNADSDTATVDNEDEIWLQRVDNAGILLEASEQRLSDIGPAGNAAHRAFDPSVAFNPLFDEVFVVFEGDDVTDGKVEIHGQLWGDSLPVDSDGDGVRDEIDLCPGQSDVGDDDGDGVPNACDQCPGQNDTLDADSDGVPACAGDCDDADAANFPGNPEVCDGQDNDCNGLDDSGSAGTAGFETDNDGDGQAECAGDCDDGDPANFQGNTEICDGQDNDCSGEDDFGGFADFETDNDGDGQAECDVNGDGLIDCDDLDASVVEGGTEICDGRDNDCNGLPDYGAIGEEIDNDGDGLAECQGDCDDSNPFINPNQAEVCDGNDNDCNGFDDAGNPGVAGEETDNDGDGQSECQGDCDDADAQRFLGNPEVCDRVDNDCAIGVPADEIDDDGDGQTECEGDCDDADANNADPAGSAPADAATRYVEVCDGADNDCNGFDDFGAPGVDGNETDDDGDGESECAGDCDDADPAVFSANPEVICDGVDQNCSGAGDDNPDADSDGVSACGPDGVGGTADDDCDDADFDTFPGAPEFCDRVDNDCDGAVPADEIDGDGDGQTGCEGDCDDADSNNADPNGSAPPDAATLFVEICDGADNDCNNLADFGSPGSETAEVDDDGDGQAECDANGDGLVDCDDADPANVEGGAEICDGQDNDCNGSADVGGIDGAESDDDGDLQAECEGDCDDTDPDINSSAVEMICNGIDEDCDFDAVTPDFVDSDGDGICDTDDICDGDDSSGDADADGVCASDVGGDELDCDDEDDTVFPGAPERCDGKDNACAGELPDEDADADGDGFSICSGDCDDVQPSINPEAEEICDEIDNNCDTLVDIIDGEECTGGCDCSHAVSGSPSPAWLALLLPAALLRRRR